MLQRLKNKKVILTGATGDLGHEIAHQCVKEGATLVLIGRNAEKLKLLKSALETHINTADQYIYTVIIDNRVVDTIYTGVKEIVAHIENVDVLINNAGSVGAIKIIGEIPISHDDVNEEDECLLDSAYSLFGGPWLITKELIPSFNHGASIINISTIFSKTTYYGRAAYTVSKAALNSISLQMAEQLGSDPRKIRVNTIYPGPIESERIHKAFINMDNVRSASLGTTHHEVTTNMTLKNSIGEGNYIKKIDVVNTVMFLASDESLGFTKHDFEVTHGLLYPTNIPLLINTSSKNNTEHLSEMCILIVAPNFIASQQLIQYLIDKNAQIILLLDDMKDLEIDANINVLPNNKKGWDSAEDIVASSRIKKINAMFIFSEHKCKENKIFDISSDDINNFLSHGFIKVFYNAQMAQKVMLKYKPTVLFLNLELDNVMSKIMGLALAQLVQTWRHETNYKKIYQVICKNTKNEKQINYNDISAILDKQFLTDALNIIVNTTQDHIISDEGSNEQSELSNIFGVHRNKIALVTGASEGIGFQTSRLLAMAGASVVMTSRDKRKLLKSRDTIITELLGYGVDNARDRIYIIADMDISKNDTPDRILDDALKKFNNIDYLINNAGVAGEEQMVIDMTLQGWRNTLQANFISNYELLTSILPYMRKNKYGHILNISSHFGGVKNSVVIYPNRADYALSKSGQRILAEELMYFLSDKIQINAVAPGPVNGPRIFGTPVRDGLYVKRSKLILENKIVNLIYHALVRLYSQNKDIEQILYILASNNQDYICEHTPLLKNTIEELNAIGGYTPSTKCIFTKNAAEKLVERLRKGMYIPATFNFDDCFNSTFNDENSEGIFSDMAIKQMAEKIESNMIANLALHRMPTEFDVAKEIILCLENTNVSGECMYPSCGLNIEDAVTVSDWQSSIASHNPMRAKNCTVMILFGSNFNSVLDLIDCIMLEGAKKIICVTTAKEFLRSDQEIFCIESNDSGDTRSVISFHYLEDESQNKIEGIPSILQQAVSEHGAPDAIISYPLMELGMDNISDLPPTLYFKELVENHINNNFIIANYGCLFNNCKIIFLTPNMPSHEISIKNAFNNILTHSLRTLTATANREAGILKSNVSFFQLEPRGSTSCLSSAILDIITVSFKLSRSDSSMIFKV